MEANIKNVKFRWVIDCGLRKKGDIHKIHKKVFLQEDRGGRGERKEE